MGLRYTLFKIYFEIKKRSGLMKYIFPVNPKKYQFCSYTEWLQNKQPYLFNSSTEVFFDLNNFDFEELQSKANNILNGKYIFFSSLEFNLGKNFDWITNPETGFKYDISKHWTEINDYSQTAGDIKYVWEKSRFTYLYTLIRDEQINKSSHADFIFSEIENWIDNNPSNCGPNYKCSQEISLRLLNWVFAIYYYSDKHLIDEPKWQKILNSIYWQLHHVYHNIHFSRIAVRNNHAITETLALYIIGTLFPFFNNAKTWALKGKKWFEKEIKYQIYEDGTFLQFSMNYHRVVIQLLSLGICIAEKNRDKFTSVVYDRAYKSVNFLYQCQEDSNGWLPNYGANDGALFLPLNSNDYRDYRPQLNVLHKILTNESLYKENGIWSEDSFWFGIMNKNFNFKYQRIKKEIGIINFKKGGYYLIREKESLTFLRCGNHKDRPSQADNLHLDIWVNGKNILVDAGSYKYNTDQKNLKYFMGTESHNTVMVGDYDQMLKGSRFIWYYWTQCCDINLNETQEYFEFSGKIKAFQFLNSNNTHRRVIKKWKNKNIWEITDKIDGKFPKNAVLKQLWHFPKHEEITFKTDNSLNTIIQKNNVVSNYYGLYIDIDQLEVSSSIKKISTIIKLN